MEDLVVNNRLTIPARELTVSYSRSSGPGGQNVNKVNSKVTLRLRVGEQSSLPSDWRQRLLARHGTRVTSGGDLLVHSDRYRDQPRNLEDCRQRLAELLRQCAVPPKRRKKTRPTLASRKRRLEDKHRHSMKKNERKPPRQ